MTGSGGGQVALRRRAVLAMAVVAIGLPWAARAHERDASADGAEAPVDLQVVDRETGEALKVWRHGERLYVAGAPGDRYGLKVINNTDRRILVVMSVDGVNILTGETAGYDQRGYIFAPHESYELDGWRKSLAEIADFTFTRLPNSYAALTGRPANVGVIGVAVFDERAEVAAAEPSPPPVERGRADVPSRYAMREAPEPPPPPPPPPPPADANQTGGADSSTVDEVVVTAEKREQSLQRLPTAVTVFSGKTRDVAGISSVQSLAAAPPPRQDEKLGTGHGAREESVMTIEPFERATAYPQFTQEIAYDTHDNLVALGVIPAWRLGERRPRPFPKDADGAGFVPDPPDDR